MHTLHEIMIARLHRGLPGMLLGDPLPHSFIYKSGSPQGAQKQAVRRAPTAAGECLKNECIQVKYICVHSYVVTSSGGGKDNPQTFSGCLHIGLPQGVLASANIYMYIICILYIYIYIYIRVRITCTQYAHCMWANGRF